jgi:hypothetical protein
MVAKRYPQVVTAVHWVNLRPALKSGTVVACLQTASSGYQRSNVSTRRYLLVQKLGPLAPLLIPPGDVYGYLEERWHTTAVSYCSVPLALCTLLKCVTLARTMVFKGSFMTFWNNNM